MMHSTMLPCARSSDVHSMSSSDSHRSLKSLRYSPSASSESTMSFSSSSGDSLADQWSMSHSTRSTASKTGAFSVSGRPPLRHDARSVVLSVGQFRPRYPSRAHLNVFSAKDTTRRLLSMISEQFENENGLYYYSDISTALQMNDGKMRVFAMSRGGGSGVERVTFIHYDLHCKSTKEVLFAVVVPNALSPKSKDRDKWRWRVDGFLTAEQIARRYGLPQHELPRSSRESERFKAELFGAKRPITEQLVEDTQWDSVQQIKSLRRGQSGKSKRKRIEIAEREWKEAVLRSLGDEELPTVPVVVNRNGAHWIEWVKMVRLEAAGVFVGISCRDQGGGRWTVQSIDLDSGRIYNKYRLVGPPEEAIRSKLRALSSGSLNIAEIVFVRDQRPMPAAEHPAAPDLNANVNAKFDININAQFNGLSLGGQRRVNAVNEQWINKVVDDMIQNERIVMQNQYHLDALPKRYTVPQYPVNDHLAPQHPIIAPPQRYPAAPYLELQYVAGPLSAYYQYPCQHHTEYPQGPPTHSIRSSRRR